jgi:SAM-dependent methyltransferase
MKAGAAFSADWLALREPFDAAAREASLPLVQALRAQTPAQGPWRVMDLGCGTGANLRWLAPRLGGAQQWLVLDHDASLLARWDHQPGWVPAPEGLLRWQEPGFGVEVLRRQTDLAQGLAALPWAAVHLVTASALLDLVGEAWLRALVAHATGARAALLLALSVDGRHAWSPRDPHDATVDALFAAHQRRDKGLGPALGAQAVPRLAQWLRGRGYRVRLARSEWRVATPNDPNGAMQRALIEGLARAALEQDPTQAPAVRGWRERRLATVARSQLRVGHLDLLAWPAR